jgi:2-hydroxy-3-oxopropionate reductase
MKKIGFIGLGIMGKPMVLNLLKSGYSVYVLSMSHSANEVNQAGAILCSSRKEISSEVDIIITMLPDSPEVEMVLDGPDGILSVMKAGQLFIDMSTISPQIAKKISERMKEKGIDSLDAPVSGGQVGAEAATLSIMVGGNSQAFEKALPIFQVMGKNIVHIGEAGAGQITKACNQMIVGMTIQAVAEAFTLATKAGVDLVKMREVLLGGFAQSKILDLHGKRIIDQNFKPGFKIKLHKKDLDIALAAGEQHDVSLLGTAQVAAQMKKAIALGNGELDHSSLVLLLQDSIE